MNKITVIGEPVTKMALDFKSWCELRMTILMDKNPVSMGILLQSKIEWNPQ